MVKPVYIFLFLVCVLLALGGIGLIFPSEGFEVAGFTVKFPNYISFLNSKKEEKKDISKILALAEEADKPATAIKTNPAKDTFTVNKERKFTGREISDTALKRSTGIQYGDSLENALYSFFEALATMAKGDAPLRILHYGDSQIEGDRITDYLRLKLQSNFGGGGPGLLSVMPVAQGYSFWQSWSNNWNRYTIFAGKDKQISHANYGVAASFCRYCNPKDSISTQSAWLRIKPIFKKGNPVFSYSRLRIFYGIESGSASLEVSENNKITALDSIYGQGCFNDKIINLQFPGTPCEIQWKGNACPDVYGVSLESSEGIIVDNFGLRGSSGTFFNMMNFDQLRKFLNTLNTRLIILQFGGNALPAIRDQKGCENFGNYLKAQIVSLKKLKPGVSILVIGPSDMSLKVEGEFTTYPLLEPLRDAIRQAAFKTNSGFFDMYECMGGHNSMLSWVEQGIAATDYIHFSPAGARKIAVLLYSAIMSDYNKFIRNKTKIQKG